MNLQTKTRHIVTSSDANYLHKAVVFYKSLMKLHANFILHVFCFDDITYKIFKKLDYKNVIIYHTSEFETAELLKIRALKKRKYEYYWACKPFIALKVLEEQRTDFISLTDCDLMFYRSPELIFDEFIGADVIIQPNNFSYQFEKDFIPVGYYCSSFLCFRNTKNSKKILRWWLKKCMDWCSSNFEKGKFGDQKYLDDWRTRFKKVREISNVGSNIAPWNIQKFDLSIRNGQIMINNKWPLIYYHYHSFRMSLRNYKYIITGDRHNYYPIPQDIVRFIYKPYIKLLKETVKDLKKIKEYEKYVETNPEGIQKKSN